MKEQNAKEKLARSTSSGLMVSKAEPLKIEAFLGNLCLPHGMADGKCNFNI